MADTLRNNTFDTNFLRPDEISRNCRKMMHTRTERALTVNEYYHKAIMLFCHIKKKK
jgi:hypothetical protein